MFLSVLQGKYRDNNIEMLVRCCESEEVWKQGALTRAARDIVNSPLEAGGWRRAEALEVRISRGVAEVSAVFV